MAYLRRLSQQRIAGVNSSARQTLDQTIAGEYAIALQIFNHHAVISAKKGAPVDWIKMEPLVAHVGLVAMTKDAPHPNAGKLLIDYILSDDGAKVMAKAGYIPTNKSAQSSVADLVPGQNYKIFLVTPDIYEKKIKDWVKIYDDLFSK